MGNIDTRDGLRAYVRELSTYQDKLNAALSTQDVNVVSELNPLYVEVAYPTPGALANGNQRVLTATLTGVILGYAADLSYSQDLQGLQISVYVSATDTAKIVISNFTGGAITLAAGTFRFYVWPRTLSTATPSANVSVGGDTGVPTGISSADVQVFTSTGTWTKPAGAKQVFVYLVGGGGGGGGGRRGASASTRNGGAGGAGGAITRHSFAASLLGATEAVTIGAAGTGGAAATSDSTNGGNGTDGGNTSFGGWLIARGGAKGLGASTAASTGGSGELDGGNGGNGGDNGDSINAGVGAQGKAAGGGGGGGGISSGNSAEAGANGGAATVMRNTGISGGAGGAATGAAGGNASDVAANEPEGGAGGGGGGARASGGVGGTGGNGGKYGGGGGGGGASVNGQNSGAGGNGAIGLAIVVTVF